MFNPFKKLVPGASSFFEPEDLDGKLDGFLDYIKGKKIYLALSGGGLALVCHIAAIRLIEKLGISPERVYGTSAGAVVGGLYAAGLDSYQMETAVLKLKNPDQLFGPGSRHFIFRAVKSEFEAQVWKNGFKKSGIYNSRRLERYIQKSLRGFFNEAPRLKELERPFSAVAFNIGSGKAHDPEANVKKVFSTEDTPEVSLKDAVMASISIPGIFVPKKIGPYYYIDGGVVENLPVVSAYEHWLRQRKFYQKNLVIMAVDLGYTGESLIEATNIRPHDMMLYAFSVEGKAINQYSLLRTHNPRRGSHVILLKPRCYDMRLTDFHKIPGAIESSYTRMVDQLEGEGFLRETREDIQKARDFLGIESRV
ncbi:MAG: patatin-like phospholipase family protein [Spirochaetota bacterium]